MVEVVQGRVRDIPYPDTTQTGPLVEVHSIVRNVHGNEISLHVEGEMKIASGEYVFARELLMNTLQVLTLTVDIPYQDGHGYIAQKHIFNKGTLDNYASIEIYDDAAEWQGPGTGLVDGSMWLNFSAKGE